MSILSTYCSSPISELIKRYDVAGARTRLPVTQHGCDVITVGRTPPQHCMPAWQAMTPASDDVTPSDVNDSAVTAVKTYKCHLCPYVGQSRHFVRN
jgi:hypothetical protein